MALGGFIHDGRFLKSYSLEGWVSEFRPLLQFVEARDLFLQRYLVPRPKCLLGAPVEHQDASVDSLRIVRCCCMVIFRVLG